MIYRMISCLVVYICDQGLEQLTHSELLTQSMITKVVTVVTTRCVFIVQCLEAKRKAVG